MPAAASARYTLRFTTPHADDEAALLAIAGAAVDSVTAPEASIVLLRGADVTRVILSGTIGSGTVATVWARPGSGTPTVAVEQVTAAGTHAQRALGGYRVEVAQ